MNVFELILSDPQGYQQTANQYSTQHAHWLLFKQQLAGLFSRETVLLQKQQQMWQSVMRNCKELAPAMLHYYMNELWSCVEEQVGRELSQLVNSPNSLSLEQQIMGQLKITGYVYNRHLPFLTIIDPGAQQINIFRGQMFALLQQHQLPSKINHYLELTFQKHCLNTLRTEVLQFDQEVRHFISNDCKQAQNFPLNNTALRNILQQLNSFKLLADYFDPTFQTLNKHCSEFIQNTTDSERSQLLSRALKYQRTFLKSFIKLCQCEQTEWLMTQLMGQLQTNVYFLCGKYCCSKILQIVVDFPESINTIVGLKKCLDRAGLLGEVGESLRRQVKRRLLIPGIITQNILNHYINMLKVLQIIDPQGLIFDKITLPVKQYLLKRNDTLRCIISHLTDDVENYSKLTQQMIKVPSKQYIEEMSSEEDENAAKEWQILPIKQNKTKVRIKYQQIDLVTVLVGLYGSQQAFIGEYQNMMAQKLMSAKDYNIDEEIRNIELLKMRFGQSALQTCNIIVKDVKDSKRNDTVIHQNALMSHKNPLSLNQLNCLAVSKGYWPINYDNPNSFQLPDAFRHIFEQYGNNYSKIKALRKIYFHYNLGHVNLTLSFQNGQFHFKCAPIQAVMINYFDQSRMREGGVSSEQLSSELQIPSNVVKQKMSFWVHKGVVKQIRTMRNMASLRRMNSFEDGQVIHYKPVSVYENVVSEEMQDDVESALLKESISMESHLRHIIEGLIISILNTNGPKPSEKIHLLLKTVYKTDLDYTYGQPQTVEILKKMLQKKKVNFNGEVYSSKDQ